MNRRGLITGVLGLIAAPAIVRAGSLMPVVPVDDGGLFTGPLRLHEADLPQWTPPRPGATLYEFWAGDQWPPELGARLLIGEPLRINRLRVHST